MKAILSGLPLAQPNINYPVLAKHGNGMVVLFTSNCTGTVVIPVTAWKLGDYGDSFSDIRFWDILPVGQTVTLSN